MAVFCCRWVEFGTLPLLQAVLNRGFRIPYSYPYEGLLVEAGTSQGTSVFLPGSPSPEVGDGYRPRDLDMVEPLCRRARWPSWCHACSMNFMLISCYVDRVCP